MGRTFAFAPVSALSVSVTFRVIFEGRTSSLTMMAWRSSCVWLVDVLAVASVTESQSKVLSSDATAATLLFAFFPFRDSAFCVF